MEISNGGAGGVRTPDLLDAIEARSQLRHGPTGCGNNQKTVTHAGRALQLKWLSYGQTYISRRGRNSHRVQISHRSGRQAVAVGLRPVSRAEGTSSSQLGHAPRKAVHVRLVHGEPAASAALKSTIESNFRWRVALPAYLQTVDLDA